MLLSSPTSISINRKTSPSVGNEFSDRKRRLHDQENEEENVIKSDARQGIASHAFLLPKMSKRCSTDGTRATRKTTLTGLGSLAPNSFFFLHFSFCNFLIESFFFVSNDKIKVEL